MGSYVVPLGGCYGVLERDDKVRPKQDPYRRVEV